MKRLKIKDNSQTGKNNFWEIGRLTSRIADKTLEQLERDGIFVFPERVTETEDITKDQLILQSINDTFRAGNVMGFLGYGNERLIIESRFGGEKEDYFFQYLLERVLDFPAIVDLKTDADQNNRLFNFLLFLFPHYLRTAMRKGLFKKYVRNGYNDGNRLLVRVKDEVRLVVEATPCYESYDRRKIVEANKKNAVRQRYFR